MQHQRRLAGAVGAEHRDALAVAHGEVDAVEPGDAVRVAEAQAAGLDRAAHAITRSGTSVATSAARNSDVGTAERERRQPRRGAGVAAREHRDVDALAALERAQEQCGRDAPDRCRLQRVARPVAARRQGDAHPPHLAGDHEQIAVHERRDQHQQPRRAHPLEAVQHVREARRRSEQDRADGADQCLGADGEERREPFARHVHRPQVDLLAAAHEGHEDGDEDHQRQHEAGTRPDHARAHPADSRDRREHERAGGEHRPQSRRRRDRHDRDPGQADDLGARVEPVDRTRRIAGDPGLVHSAHRRATRATAPPIAKTISVPAKPATAVAALESVL